MNANVWFPLNNLKIYLIHDNQRIHVELVKGGYASIWSGVTAPDRHEKLHIFAFRSTSEYLMNGFFKICMVHDHQLNTVRI